MCGGACSTLEKPSIRGREGRQASVTLQLTCWITTSKSLHKTKTNSWGSYLAVLGTDAKIGGE